MMSANFKTWMKKVEDLVERLVGVSVGDLPDCNYMDWFEDGLSPMRAAKRAIKNMQY